MPKVLTQLERINHLEHVVSQQNKLLKKLACQFAWYWYDERRKYIAMIGKLSENRADLVVFTSNWSGGMSVVEGAELFIYDDDLEPDEQKRTGKWEPMLELSEVLQDLEKNLRSFEPADEDDEPEPKLFKGKTKHKDKDAEQPEGA